jgi:hypothetical protein
MRRAVVRDHAYHFNGIALFSAHLPEFKIDEDKFIV